MTQYNISDEFSTLVKAQENYDGSAPIEEILKAFNKTTEEGRAEWDKYRSDKEIKVSKEKFKTFDNREIETWIIEPWNIEKECPCLVYYHGGAFIMGPMEVHVNLTREYALRTPCKVVFVDYRLAPENPFPIGFLDCYNALLWTYNNAVELGIDRRRIAVAGDSAGGNLAAAVAQMGRDKNGPSICFQLLCYPVTDRRMNSKSMKEFKDTPFWDSQYNEKMWEIYLKNGHKGMLQYTSPMEAESFRNVPDGYVEVAEFDPLRDEGKEYAESLIKGGSKVYLNETKGTIHGYDTVIDSTITQNNINKRIEILREVFGKLSDK